jgi:hypothetical protein
MPGYLARGARAKQKCDFQEVGVSALLCLAKDNTEYQFFQPRLLCSSTIAVTSLLSIASSPSITHSIIQNEYGEFGEICPYHYDISQFARPTVAMAHPEAWFLGTVTPATSIMTLPGGGYLQ